jgi:hypothetical protein
MMQPVMQIADAVFMVAHHGRNQAGNQGAAAGAEIG